MSDDDLYKKAERRADEKISFYKHFFSFISVNILLFVINAFTSWGDWWFYWVTVFWGIGFVIHFIKTFVVTEKLEDNRDEMIRKEMEKMKK